MSFFFFCFLFFFWFWGREESKEVRKEQKREKLTLNTHKTTSESKTNAVVSDLWRELGGGTELRADSLGFGDSDGSDFDGVGLSSSSSASSADFYYDGASESRAALNDEEMGALMSDDSFIAMAERDTVDDDDEGEVEEEDEGAGAPSRNKGSALRI